MANSIASDLIVDTLKNSAVTILQNRLAPLAAFSRDFGADSLRPRATVQVPKATGASAVQVNPASFETGDTTLANIAVTVDQYSKSFHVTNDQANSGIKLAMLAEVNLGALADKIMDVAFAPLSAAAESYSGTAASFTASDLQDAWAAIAKSEVKNAILRGDFYAKFLPTNLQSFKPGAGAYGFDGFYANTRFPAGNIGGYILGPSALAVASGLPQNNTDGLVASETVTIPGVGLAVQLNLWSSSATRSIWASYDVMFGATAGDLDAAAKITAA